MPYLNLSFLIIVDTCTTPLANNYCDAGDTFDRIKVYEQRKMHVRSPRELYCGQLEEVSVQWGHHNSKGYKEVCDPDTGRSS